MAAVPQDMIAELIGQTVTRVAIERWSVLLLLETGSITIGGCWRLIDPHGTERDAQQELGQRKDFQLWQTLGCDVEESKLSSHNGLHLQFRNGFRLEVEASDGPFEDWQVTLTDGRLLVANGEDLTCFT